MLKTSFEYELSQPIKYTEKGDFTEGQLLVFYAPSMKSIGIASKLKQGFIKALKPFMDDSSQGKKTTNRNQSKEASASEWVLLLMLSDVDMSEIYEHFQSLLCEPGICKIEDSKDMTKSVLENISIADMENLLGEYAQNFLLSSLLASQK
jgi:hypothetical protein